MDFTFSADQLALRDGVREFCLRRYGEEALRAQAPADAALWRDLGGLGVFALRLPEPQGSGLGVAVAAVALEELGRALVPGPLVGTVLAAGIVDGAGDGTTAVGVLDSRSEPLLVEHPDLVAELLVFDGHDVRRLAAPAGEPVALAVDPLTPMHRLEGGLAAGETIGSPDLALIGTVLTAAYQLGIAESVTHRSVGYAKGREQFGRTIGSFQAVKHMCADMLVRTELAQAAVYAAAVTIDDPEVGEPGRAAAIAKLLADEAALTNAKTAIQVHGGMGFTWDLPIHLYLKRAWVLSTTFGALDEHALALADAV